MDSPEGTSGSEPTTAEILAEVERRREQARPQLGDRQRRLILAADRLLFWLSKRWLAIANSLAVTYIALPILAPVLMHVGLTVPAAALYALYDPLCNQLPQRSWFLFGAQYSYGIDELNELLGEEHGIDRWDSGFVGSEAVGYKMALCQRCTSMHLAIAACGVAYALLRRKYSIRPLPWWAYVALFLPMALDGGYQLLTYITAQLWPRGPIQPHETSPLMRLITGALGGIATIWLAYPHLAEAMDDLRDTLSRRFGWE
jgi:uncharacterized membrane protein